MVFWTDDPRRQLGRSIVATGCAYEIVALYSSLPTITALYHGLRRRKQIVFKVLTWVLGGFAAAHFLSDP